MKIRTLGLLVGLSAIASSFLSCTQAKITCATGHAGAGSAYAAQFFLTGTAPTCAAGIKNPVLGTSIDTMPGDSIGFETYHPVQTTPDGISPDFSKGTVALQADALGVETKAKTKKKAVDTDPTHKMYAIGDWVSEEVGTDDFCSVQNIKPAEQSYPMIPAVMGTGGAMPTPGSPAVPPLDIKYEWKNLKLYVTAAATGTQFSADLTYTQDSCSVDYHVRGVWPGISCAKEVPAPTAMDPDATTFIPDESACCQDANPDAGIASGSGINPDFPVHCHPDMLMCVLDAPDDAKLPILGGNKCKPGPQ